jgi:hypothetical protein
MRGGVDLAPRQIQQHLSFPRKPQSSTPQDYRVLDSPPEFVIGPAKGWTRWRTVTQEATLRAGSILPKICSQCAYFAAIAMKKRLKSAQSGCPLRIAGYVSP